MFLSDDPANPTLWRVSEGITIDSGQHLIFYASGDVSQFPDHTNFKLSGGGEALALVDIDGTSVIDMLIFDTQSEDVSYGRFPDGTDTWGFHQAPTPGAPNEAHGI